MSDAIAKWIDQASASPSHAESLKRCIASMEGDERLQLGMALKCMLDGMRIFDEAAFVPSMRRIARSYIEAFESLVPPEILDIFEKAEELRK